MMTIITWETEECTQSIDFSFLSLSFSFLLRISYFLPVCCPKANCCIREREEEAGAAEAYLFKEKIGGGGTLHPSSSHLLPFSSLPDIS